MRRFVYQVVVDPVWLNALASEAEKLALSQANSAAT